MNCFGDKIKLALFGESHGTAIGFSLDGLEHGFEPDFSKIEAELSRRSPGSVSYATSRRDTSQYEILSGIFNGKTDGTPLTVIFRNTDTDSKSYNPDIPRPSHADYPAHIKYDGCNDYRGGGAFSGRLTLPLVFAGAICRQLLQKRGISVYSHIYSVGAIYDTPFCELREIGSLKKLDSLFPLFDEKKRVTIENAVNAAKQDGDSIGGIVECIAYGIPVGLGEPFFGSTESKLSQLLFSIPAVKGVEFGAGFGISSMSGSAANDALYCENGRVFTRTNNSGGINGGLTNGMPIVLRCAFRPVPSISKPQATINLTESCKTDIVSISGRHDACVLPRACVVVEAATCIGLYDLI